MKFVIIGGGIAGLATAIALRKASHEVIVLEAKPEFTEVCMATLYPSRATYHQLLVQSVASYEVLN